MKKTAQQGYAEAQYNLGVSYDSGTGVPQNYSKAVMWYTKAAQQGLVVSQINLGGHYFKGQGVQQNYATAAYWVTKAAQQGSAKAQYMIGLLYASGKGVKQNNSTAYKWFELAKATSAPESDDYTGASRLMQELASKMTPAEINKAQQEASNWFEQYQKKSNAEAPTAVSQLTPPSDYY